MMATVRKIAGVQYLWTCRQIGVNSAGNKDNPPSGTGPADRSAVEWIKLQMTPSVSIAAIGRIYDTAATNQKFYYMPSLAANNLGDMVIGFSGSSANDYIGAYYTGLSHTGSSPSLPIRYFTGKDWFVGPKIVCGDYSYTSLDPDGLTIWTIQEYAETRYDTPGQQAWGTRVAHIAPF